MKAVLPIPPPPKRLFPKEIELRRYPEINERVEELVSNWVCEYTAKSKIEAFEGYLSKAEKEED